LIPASGFFEWTGPKENRQPWYITAKDGKPLTFAGLHETWRDQENDETVESSTMIITSLNSFMSKIHDRMPVILAPDSWAACLDAPNSDLLRPADEDMLHAWPVTPQVKSSRYYGDDSIIPLQPA
jgi:putative SOS response-associated peptidase YedK